MTMTYMRCVGLALSVLLLLPLPAGAYEDDTHYLMTYVICRSVGFTHGEAIQVAMANVAMDDEDSLVAAGTLAGSGRGRLLNIDGTPLDIQAHVDASWMWHAIAPSDASRNPRQNTLEILEQKDLLFQLALDKWLDPALDADGLDGWRISPAHVKERLKWLGVFFHYQQDTWAHRRPKPSANARRTWESYMTPFGHVGDSDGITTIHHQDRPPWHPLAAMRNLEDGIAYAGTFLRAVMNREPNPYFVDFEITSWRRRTDNSLPGSSSMFGQISRVAVTDAGKYLEALLHAQIGTYTSSYDSLNAVNTANEASLEAVRAALEKVWKDKGLAVRLGADDFMSTADLKEARQQKRKLEPYVGTNELVATMAGWQEILGFPTTANTYDNLFPHLPNPQQDLKKITGAWWPFSSQGGIGVDERGQTQFANFFVDVSAVTGPGDGAPNIALMAVGDNGSLWHQARKGEPWTLVPNSRGTWGAFSGIVAAKVLPDGTFIGVTSEYRLATKASLKPEDRWKVIENSEPMSVAHLTVNKEGMIAAVDRQGQLKTARLRTDKRQSEKMVPNEGRGVLSDYLLDGGWQALPTKDAAVVMAVAVMPNQVSYLGVSPKGVLLYKSDLSARWKRAPNSNAFAITGTRALGSVAMLPDGTLLGTRRGTTDILRKEKGKALPYPSPDDLPETWDGMLKSGPRQYSIMY